MSNSEAKPQRPGDSQKLTRRQILKAVGATIVGGGSVAIFGRSLAAEPGNEAPIIIGTLERVEPPDLLHISSANPSQSAQTIIVKVPSTATISRGLQGIVSSTDVFVPGDKVVAEGEWKDGLFVATALMSLYYYIEGEIIERRQERLETTAGVILLTPESEKAAADGYEAVPLDELADGDEIAALVWNDPISNTNLAARVAAHV
jgi:hypothetical protein